MLITNKTEILKKYNVLNLIQNLNFLLSNLCEVKDAFNFSSYSVIVLDNITIISLQRKYLTQIKL